MTNYRELMRLRSLGLNHSQIADSLGVSRTTVIHAMQRAAAQGLDWQTAESMSGRELAARLFPQGEGKAVFTMPDYDRVHCEMAKSGVTLQMLWMEYSDKCHVSGLLPYQFTQFKKYYRDYLLQTKATMHIQRKPGELMEVDWAGTTAQLVDPDMGEIIEAYIFVAALPYSGYAYAEAFLSMEQENWIAAHVNAYNFFGGVTRILVSDNLKTGVIKNTRSELALNRTYPVRRAIGAGSFAKRNRTEWPNTTAQQLSRQGYASRRIRQWLKEQ